MKKGKIFILVFKILVLSLLFYYFRTAKENMAAAISARNSELQEIVAERDAAWNDLVKAQSRETIEKYSEKSNKLKEAEEIDISVFDITRVAFFMVATVTTFLILASLFNQFIANPWRDWRNRRAIRSWGVREIALQPDSDS